MYVVMSCSYETNTISAGDLKNNSVIIEHSLI